MAAPDVEAEIIGLIARHADVQPGTVRATGRLVDDLGLRSDDADALFKRIHQRFGTDLRPLHRRWNDYFTPRLSPGCGFVLFFVCIASPLALFMMPLVLFLAFAVALLFWLASLWWQSHRLPITVGEVVTAVEAGAWPNQSSHWAGPSTPAP